MEPLSPIGRIINAYRSSDLDSLSKGLNNLEHRIQFEDWLIDNFSEAKNADWQTKVVTLLCEKTQEDKIESREQKQTEDLLLADLISKAIPKNYTTVEAVKNFVLPIIGRTNINSQEILAAIKKDALPTTTKILLRRALDRQDFNLVFDVVFQSGNLNAAKIIADKYLEKFKSGILTKDIIGMTPVHWAASHNDVEMLKLIAAKAPDEFRTALAMNDMHGRTPIQVAATNIEILRFMAKAAPDELKSAMLIKDDKGKTSIHREINRAIVRNDMEMIKFIEEIAPDEFKHALSIDRDLIDNAFLFEKMEMLKFLAAKAPDEFRSSPAIKKAIQGALIHNDKNLLKFLAESALAEFKEAIATSNINPITRAILDKDMETFKFLAVKAPDAFRSALAIKDKFGNTPIYQAEVLNREMLKHIAKAAPNEFKSAILIKDEDGKTLVHRAALRKDMELLTFIAKIAPVEFQSAMSMENMASALRNNVGVARLMASKAPDAFKAAITQKDSEGKTLVHHAAKENGELFRFLGRLAPDTLTVKDSHGNTPLHHKDEKGRTLAHLAVIQNDREMLAFIAKMAPDEFKAFMTAIDDEGNTPVHLAALKNTEMFRLMALHAPDEFRAAMTMKGNDGKTPIDHAAAGYTADRLTLIAENAPSALKSAMNLALFRQCTGFRNSPQVMKIIAERALETPDEWKAWSSEKDSRTGETFLHEAVKNNNVEMVRFLSNLSPEEFKSAMITADADGRTPLHRAYSPETMEIMFDTAPDEFVRALSIKDLDDFTPIHAGVSKANVLAFIAEKAPGVLKALMLVKDQIDQTLLHMVAESGNVEAMEILAKIDPDAFKAIMLMQDKAGRTPIYLAVEKNKSDMLKFMAREAHVEFNKAMTIKDHFLGQTPFHLGASNNNTAVSEFAINMKPNELISAMTAENTLSQTPIDLALKNNGMKLVELAVTADPDEFRDTIASSSIYECSLDMMKMLAEKSPQEFNSAMASNQMRRFRGSQFERAVNRAVYDQNIAILEFLYEKMPDEFKAAVTVKISDGSTIFSMNNFDNIRVVKFLAEKMPEEFRATVRSMSPESLDSIKNTRPHHHKDITKLYKNDPEYQIFRKIHKELIKRAGVSHAFSLKGSTKIIEIGFPQKVLRTQDLEGHHSESWFNMMSKDINLFEKFYPDLLSDDQMAMLRVMFDLGANSNLYSPEEKLARVQDGRPLLLNAGFKKHAVNVLVFKNKFIICNTGDLSRRPLEIYDFNPQKFDKSVLEDIENARSEWDLGYKKLFFETLPKKLEFSQSDFDRQLESANFLPNQTVGNCSFASPITSIYAGLLLSCQDEADRAHALFQTWFGFEQLTILERLIQPSETFMPDHPLILEGLRKAHLLPLDAKCRQKLDELTEIYANSLQEDERRNIEIDLLYWKMLANS